MINYNQKDIDRFWSKIIFPDDLENDCWKINCAEDKDGYKQFSVNGKQYRAHRFMYMIHHQEENIEYKLIRHSCDHPWCVNPHHLSSGSYQDNKNDCVSKDRQAKGSLNGNSKLTEEDIEEIMINTLSGYFTNRKEIADHYKVKKVSINKLINETYWTHITKNYDMNKIRDLLSARLTIDNIRDIKQRLKNGETYKNISKFYRVSDVTILYIRSGKLHKDVV